MRFSSCKNKLTTLNPVLLMVVCLSFGLSSHAQVTIGSGYAPQTGALLELKENENVGDNSSKGFLYPRVALIKNNELYPMYNVGDTDYENNKVSIKELHTGLTVYNTTLNEAITADMDIFEPGIYVWNGVNWLKMNNTLLTEASIPQIQELQCSGAVLSPNTYTEGVAYTGVLTVPYAGGNGALYDAGTPATVNGLTYTLQAGTLATGSGALYYTVSGTPDVSSPAVIDFPISFAGLDCVASIAGNSEVKTMEYLKAVLSPLPDAPIPGFNGGYREVYSSPITMGNLVIYYYRWRNNSLGIATGGEEIRFASLEDTHATFLYTKSGSGGNYNYYGQGALQANREFSMGNAQNVQGSSYDINSGNRDYAVLLITFHTTQEIYRVSFNIHGIINASDNVAAINDPTLTVFIERLD